MATLTIWDTAHHKVIHGMVWQVEDVEQTLFDSGISTTFKIILDDPSSN